MERNEDRAADRLPLLEVVVACLLMAVPLMHAMIERWLS
jgi:hypothetical protein